MFSVTVTVTVIRQT